MKSSTPILLSLGFIATSTFAAEPPLKKSYQQPSRGFFLEHGSVKPEGSVSIELNSGTNNLNAGGGIRLGLPNAELLINTGLDSYDTNEALLKWALPEIDSDEESLRNVDWALLAGIASINIDNGLDQTNLKIGLAATVSADAGTFTISPQLIYSDGDLADDIFLEVDLGAYVGLIDTTSGLFSLGAEANITTEDNADNQFSFGARWAYNERINMDIIPVIFNNNDMRGLPGLVRLNVVF
jgi:hypothetical protein